MIREAEGDGTPYRRVLDMLAGWAAYVDSCIEGANTHEEKAAYEAESEALHAFYLDLAARSGAYSELDRQAYCFLQEKVIRLIVLGAGRT